MLPKVARVIILVVFFLDITWLFGSSKLKTFKHPQGYWLHHFPVPLDQEITARNKIISSETRGNWNTKRDMLAPESFRDTTDRADPIQNKSTAEGTSSNQNAFGEARDWSKSHGMDSRRSMTNFTDTSWVMNKSTHWVDISTSPAEKVKVILAWNSYFERRDFGAAGFGKTPFVTCPVSNCFLTDNHTYLSESSALLFHIRNAVPGVRHREERQLYVFFVTQSPAHSRSHLNRNYNLTMTYRLDSDIAIPFGDVYRKPRAESPYQLKFPLANRTRSVAWIVSNCGTASKRERYVEKLKRYIDVDVYGACGSMSGCGWNEDSDCRQKIASKYKFYLSFENSLCQDYVTEKLFRALSMEIVPIVYGGTNYSRDAPPHSVINVEDYSSPEELARYLKHLTSNETEYNAYFEWKSTYGIREKLEVLQRGFCKLCEIVNTPSFHKTYANMTSWWPTGKCKAPIL